VNPQVGALSDNAGPTLTIPLLAGSPATDQRGFFRIDEQCDAGAYEAVAVGLPASDDAVREATVRFRQCPVAY